MSRTDLLGQFIKTDQVVGGENDVALDTMIREVNTRVETLNAKVAELEKAAAAAPAPAPAPEPAADDAAAGDEGGEE